MDLVQQQNESRQVRNPFGFDFTDKYNSRPYTIPGDGKWYTLVGGLADHAITHLMSKIINQYHDEQVAALKAQGRDEEANHFEPGKVVENTVYKMITGENIPDVSEAAKQQEIANLSELKSEMSHVTAQAATGASPINVSSIVEQAQADALNGQTSGAFVAPQAPEVAQAAAPVEPVVTPVDQSAPQEQSVDQPETPAFADLQQQA